ncbi:MAG: HD domain-containing protein [Syntrophomonas sp.]|uniref:HD domain-containing protein n=1 Tax=Syntrophomonas sp. TaxID=2053627 RepID=UPI0026369A20|nr:HD domain-containing protein [Syntrophomonas sp.]MDD2510451.1 HD domain-containing protein [Syntrophomonas sp.]MDD4626707.1 HD domain-containing protein [Syntrophomonas sp.]
MKRVELLINDEFYTEYMHRNREEEQEPKFCQHDFQHHLNVARIAYILILEQNLLSYFVKESGLSGKLAGKEVIYAAGLLHDIGKWQEYKTGIDHASFGSRLTREILPRAHFNPLEIDLISRAVYEHRNIRQDMSFLGERLHRADNLSRICRNCEYNEQCPKFKNKELTISNFEY